MSRKVRTIELSVDARQALEQGYSKGSTHAFRKRCHVVLLKAGGRSSKDIGGIVSMHEVSVNHWLNRYEGEGLPGLSTKAGRGRKPLLDEGKDAATVREILTEERQRLGRAKELLEQKLDKQFSGKTLKRFLKSLAAATNEEGGGRKESAMQSFMRFGGKPSRCWKSKVKQEALRCSTVMKAEFANKAMCRMAGNLTTSRVVSKWAKARG